MAKFKKWEQLARAEHAKYDVDGWQTFNQIEINVGDQSINPHLANLSVYMQRCPPIHSSDKGNSIHVSIQVDRYMAGEIIKGLLTFFGGNDD